MDTNKIEISEELLKILACPITGKRLRMATPQELDEINSMIKQQTIKRRNGNKIEIELEAALITDDGKIVYTFEEGIPNLLAEDGIELSE